jgi:hypothetical protein
MPVDRWDSAIRWDRGVMTGLSLRTLSLLIYVGLLYYVQSMIRCTQAANRRDPYVQVRVGQVALRIAHSSLKYCT